ncbi:MAG: protein kinase [Planctomycetaceae bacterium]|nr:protein kinase [Planctomycetales bacterium]MCB9925145.1 protein kinase [Planctomycetaceae bacterium]
MHSSSQKTNRIANFSLIRMLGQGGFGAVWLAKDRSLGRQVALKLPKATGKDSKLLHEAQTAARLKHPNIVSIYEVGVDEGQVFIASEYIDGEDLRDEMARAKPEVSRTVKVIATIAHAVHHAHKLGVVHRDLKPANVILNAEGEPFITDFGIAKHLSAEDTISTDGEVIGTISYMSPEQARGSTRETDSRSDIYALGVMLFEMLTEFRPFRGNARAVIHQKIYDDPPSPRKLVPALAKDLETICLKCLEREPAKRYQSALELAEELERFRNNIPIKARPISRGEKLWRWCRRKPAVAVLLFGFILSLSCGLASTSYFWHQAIKNEAKTRASLYRTQMSLAGKLWAAGDIAGLRHTLASHEGYANAESAKRFEWDYYSRLTEPFLQAVNHGEVVTDVGVSFDGQLFASTGHDRVIRIWSSSSGQIVRTLQPRAGKPGTIMFSPVDDRIVSAHGDGQARLWNPQQHDHTIREFPHGPGLTHVLFSYDARHLITAGSNGKVLMWKVGTGEQVADLSLPKRAVRDFRFSADDRFVVVAAQGGGISIWECESQEYVQSMTAGIEVFSVSFVDEGRLIAAGTYGGTLAYFSSDTGELVETVAVDGGVVGDLEYLPNVDLLAAVTTAHRLHLIDAQRHSVRTLVTHALTHGMLAHSQDGSMLVVGSGDGTVKLLQVSALQRPDVYWQDSHIRDLEFVAGGRKIASCTGDGTVSLWDVETGEKSELVARSDHEMLALAAQAKGHLLAASGMFREVLVFDTSTNEKVGSISLPYSGFSSLGFSASGDLLATGSRSGEVRVYATGHWDEPKWEWTDPDVEVFDLRFSLTGETLAVAYSNGKVKLIDLSRSEPTIRHLQLKTSPLSLNFCNLRGELAIGTQDGEIHVINSLTLETLRIFKAHSSRINALSSFPSGDRLVSGGRDRELRIWDFDSGELVASLVGHGRQVFATAVSPDGTTIASGGLGGDIRIWRGARHSHKTATEPDWTPRPTVVRDGRGDQPANADNVR